MAELAAGGHQNGYCYIKIPLTVPVFSGTFEPIPLVICSMGLITNEAFRMKYS